MHLAAGNGVLAKPADPTPLTASIGVRLLHEAGVPLDVLQCLPGEGAAVGVQLTSDPRIAGVCFTGSTGVAQSIHRKMAETLAPDAMLIAETGGLNAMIVDSTALPEQAVRDIVVSAFQSAGQRCSALRVLYLQEDIAEPFMEMLFGAMDELAMGDPWAISTDVGPVISDTAQAGIEAHIAQARAEGRLLKELAKPSAGLFVAPTAIRIDGIADLAHEVFGPVLHIATFAADEIDQVVQDINDSGYGLTFGVHSRIDDRVQELTTALDVGNIYVNRNQIGAIVGSQPFGGEGMSGTGPKAGGPRYVPRFLASPAVEALEAPSGKAADIAEVQSTIDAAAIARPAALRTEDLPGPTGESNRLSIFPRGRVLCLGPTVEQAREQAQIAEASGCPGLIVVPGALGENAIDGWLERSALTGLRGFEVVALWADTADLRQARQALASREGAILPLAVNANELSALSVIERHVCIDTTASGGNATLLAAG